MGDSFQKDAKQITWGDSGKPPITTSLYRNRAFNPKFLVTESENGAGGYKAPELSPRSGVRQGDDHTIKPKFGSCGSANNKRRTERVQIR
jgi:hypothetical protein